MTPVMGLQPCRVQEAGTVLDTGAVCGLPKAAPTLGANLLPTQGELVLLPGNRVALVTGEHSHQGHTWHKALLVFRTPRRASPASPSRAPCNLEDVLSLLHPLLFPLPLLVSCSWLCSLSRLRVLSCHRWGAADKSKQPEPGTRAPALPSLGALVALSLAMASPEAAGGRQSPRALLSPGGSSPFPMPFQDGHKEAVGEGVCGRGTEAALCPREGSQSSAGPGREGVHQPVAWDKGQGSAPQPTMPQPTMSPPHLKSEPCSCSTACTTSSFSSRCREQVE